MYGGTFAQFNSGNEETGKPLEWNRALSSHFSIFSQVHMRTGGGVGPRSNSGGKSNSGGGKRKKVMQMVKGEEKKRLTPLFKRKRESIV